jgi:type II secretory ATPase GspE/PulE/Tfp pilus assembly ATPase PilB-like protein
MLGTVPQGDTLKFVMERAQSEVLVFGKMDGLNAFTSLDSLQGLGIPPYLAALATNAVLSQQLLPQLCEKCKKPTKLSPNLMKQFQNILQTKDLNFYQRVGCDACRMTGYDGSIAIYELLSVDRKIADMVMKGASSMEIRNYALSTGMEPMKIDALRKAAMGLTTYQEVMKLK